MSELMAYMTFETMEEAQRTGEELVRERLAACVNILPGMRSMYWWQGRVEKTDEVVVVAKTRKGLEQALTTFVRERHSYEVPCIVFVSIVGGNPDFLQWIRTETRERKDSAGKV